MSQSERVSWVVCIVHANLKTQHSGSSKIVWSGRIVTIQIGMVLYYARIRCEKYSIVHTNGQICIVLTQFVDTIQKAITRILSTEVLTLFNESQVPMFMYIYFNCPSLFFESSSDGSIWNDRVSSIASWKVETGSLKTITCRLRAF